MGTETESTGTTALTGVTETAATHFTQPDATADAQMSQASESNSVLGYEAAILEAQGLAVVSEANLRGMEDAKEPASSEVPQAAEVDKAAASDAAASTAETVQVAPSTVPEVKPESPEDVTQVTKPPKGYVPLEALHEARGENRYLKERLSALEQQMKQIPPAAQAAIEPVSDFKALSDEEYVTLAKEDPTEALLYMQKLAKHQQVEFERKMQGAEEERQITDVIKVATAKMEAVVPGLFNPDDRTAHDQLAGFAESVGFTEDLFFLTNPATQIVMPGDDTPVLLGEKAASILRVLVNAQSKLVSSVQPNTPSRAQIEAELRSSIEAEILAKLKGTAAPVRTLSQLPQTSNAGVQDFSTASLTPAQLAQLTPVQERAYLSGN